MKASSLDDPSWYEPEANVWLESAQPWHRPNPEVPGFARNRASVKPGGRDAIKKVHLQTPTLRTDRLLLRPFADADTDAIFALQCNAQVLRYWDTPPWAERSQAERFIKVCKQIEQEGSGARLAIERAANGAFIGWCCLVKWNPDYRSARMGYCLDNSSWGQGFATEAADSLLHWAFDTLDLNRVQAETDTRNRASSRVLEKLGFVREGKLREDCIVNGEVSDSWVYGLLRWQWKPRFVPPPRS